MNLTEIASRLFLEQITSQSSGLSADTVQNALTKLLPMTGNELDIPSILGMFTQNGGLVSLANSWLCDNENMALSPENLISVLGQSKVNDFASQLGMDTDTAASGLSNMIPELIDKASSGGSLKNDIAGSLVSGLAGKLFG